MKKWMIFLMFMMIVETAHHPVVFIHGVCGSVLEAHLDIPDKIPLPHWICTRKSDNKRLWLNLAELIPIKLDCLLLFAPPFFENLYLKKKFFFFFFSWKKKQLLLEQLFWIQLE